MSGGCSCRSSPMRGANSASSNPLAGFVEALSDREKKENEKGEGKKRDREDGTGENSPRTKFLVTALE